MHIFRSYQEGAHMMFKMVLNNRRNDIVMLLTLDIATHPSWYLWSHPRSFYQLSQNSSPHNLTTLSRSTETYPPSITHCIELNYHTLRSLLPSRCIKVWTLALRNKYSLRENKYSLKQNKYSLRWNKYHWVRTKFSY
jgi:hypothetical protein